MTCAIVGRINAVDPIKVEGWIVAALVVMVITIVHSDIIDGPGGICRTSNIRQ